jgi:hypothetical protein
LSWSFPSHWPIHDRYTLFRALSLENKFTPVHVFVPLARAR